MLVIVGAHIVSADTYKDVTVWAVGKNSLGQVIVTEKLEESWTYDNSKVTWYSNSPTYTVQKAWWLFWAYTKGEHSGVKTINPDKKYMAYGSAHYYAVSTPWGSLIHQDIYLNLYFYYNGVYYQDSGYAYET